jgi:hypothetical protein
MAERVELMEVAVEEVEVVELVAALEQGILLGQEAQKGHMAEQVELVGDLMDLPILIQSQETQEQIH